MEQRYIDKFHESYSPEALTGCFIWTRAIDCDGYGIYSFSRKYPTYKAHRFSAMIHGLDMSGDVMRHTCNNPSCVNPAHLQTGSFKVNSLDMVKAKRAPVKISDEDVLVIRNEWATGSISQKTLSKRYRVSEEQIRRIINKTSRKHI